MDEETFLDVTTITLTACITKLEFLRRLVAWDNEPAVKELSRVLIRLFATEKVTAYFSR